MPQEDEAEPSAIEIHRAIISAVEKERADVIQSLYQSYPAYESDIVQCAEELDKDTKTTPLWVAVRLQKIDAIRTLLACNATLSSHILDKGHMSPYVFAKRKQWDRVCQIFHEYLIQQIAMDKLERVNELLDIGVSPNATDGSPLNSSLLHWAVTCGSVRVLKRLLETSEIDVTLINSKGATALDEAIVHEQVELIKILLEKANGRYGEKTMELVEKSKSDEIQALFQQNSRLNHVPENKSTRNQLERLVEEKNILIQELQQTLEQVMMDQDIKRIESPSVVDFIQRLRREKQELQDHYQQALDHIEYLERRLKEATVENPRPPVQTVQVEPVVVDLPREEEPTEAPSFLMSLWWFFFAEDEEEPIGNNLIV